MSLLMLYRPRSGVAPPVVEVVVPPHGFDRRKPLTRVHVGRAARKRRGRQA